MMFLLTLACSDHGLSLQTTDPLFGEAVISVNPRKVDFFSGLAGEELVREVTVFNIGTAILFVDSVELTGSDAFSMDALGSFDLQPGEARSFDVRFKPLDPNRVEGVIAIASNDDDFPVLEVPVEGSGLTPWLQITPDDHDFGEAELGCGDAVGLLLQNVGLDVLNLTSWQAAGHESVAYAPEDGWPLSLVPGAFTRVEATWTAAVEGDQTGEIRVSSNDPRGDVSAFQLGTGLPGEVVVDSFIAEQSPPVDLVFAIDQSCSMDDDATSLGDNFGAFVETLSGQTWRWRIGVVTWDHACFNSGILKPGTANLEAVFAAAVVDGDDLDISDDEALLKLSSRALAQTGTGQCNEGFLRDGAPLHIVVVSDEPERSTEQASAWTWDYWMDEIAADAPDRDITVHGVVDADDCNDGDDGYAEAIAATGGQHLSICDGDWAAHVAALAESVLTTLWVFDLSQDPVPGSVSVTVDGASSGDWTWDAATNAVTFSVDLAEGQVIEIQYSVAAVCD